VTSQLEAMRARTERRRMTDRCTIRRPDTGGATVDRDTLTLVVGEPQVIYSGPCSVQEAGRTAGNPGQEAGGEVTTMDYLVRLPAADPSASEVRKGDEVTVDAIGRDGNPSLLGAELEVSRDDKRTRRVTVQLRCIDTHQQEPFTP
jgi:hypothetical protein